MLVSYRSINSKNIEWQLRLEAGADFRDLVAIEKNLSYL
jgi:hypothetical protein